MKHITDILPQVVDDPNPKPAGMQVSQAITVPQTNIGLVPYVADVGKKLLPTEGRVMEMKYASKRFGMMGEEELRLTATRLLVTISVITGWTMPFLPEHTKLMAKELTITLRERWGMLNEEEMGYIFRNKGIDVKDWGRPLNIALLQEAIAPYLEIRSDLSRQEEKLASQAQLKRLEQKQLGAPEMTDEEGEEWLEAARSYEFDAIPNDLYAYLERSGKLVLSKEEKYELVDKAVGYILAHLDVTGADHKTFLAQKNEGCFTGDCMAKIKTIAKKFAVKNYLDTTNPDL